MVEIVHLTVFESESWIATVSGNMLPLLTSFMPPAGCSTQWISTSGIPGTIHSGFQGQGDDDYGMANDYYARCLPGGQITPEYSPGVCTSGQTMGGITVYSFEGSSVWAANCCDRLLFPSKD